MSRQTERCIANFFVHSYFQFFIKAILNTLDEYNKGSVDRGNLMYLFVRMLKKIVFQAIQNSSTSFDFDY